MELDACAVAFLRRPGNAPEMSEGALDALQQEHLAFWARLREGGHVVVSGHFAGQPDPSLRGISVFRTPLEETRRPAEQDPSVQAGRLALGIFTWLTPHGALGSRPAATIEREWGT